MLNKKTNKLPKRCKSFLSRLYDILNDKEYLNINSNHKIISYLYYIY